MNLIEELELILDSIPPDGHEGQVVEAAILTLEEQSKTISRLRSAANPFKPDSGLKLFWNCFWAAWLSPARPTAAAARRQTIRMINRAQANNDLPPVKPPSLATVRRKIKNFSPDLIALARLGEMPSGN